MLLDDAKAKSAYTIIKQDFDKKGIKIVEKFLIYPSDEPWNLSPYKEIPERFKKKIEDGTLKDFSN